jgi:hypothetical protein
MDDFFSTLAQVAAGLLAIVFVTFQIRIEYWQKDKLRHLVAIRTLGEFLLVLVFSMLCLAYPNAWQLFAAIMGLVVLASVSYYQGFCLRNRPRLVNEDRVQFVFSPLADVEAAFLLVAARWGDLAWLPPLLLWLLFSRTAQAWRLLTPPAD